MSWTAPRTWIPGELVTASMLNTHVRDNEIELRAGGLSLLSQAQYDLMFASSDSQWERLATAADSVLVTDSSGEPGWGPLPTPEVVTTTDTGTVNDFALPSGTKDVLLRCDNPSLLTITGFTNPSPGRRVYIASVGAGLVGISNLTGSGANNQIVTGYSMNLVLSGTIGRMSFIYDGTASKWRVIYTSELVAQRVAPATPPSLATIWSDALCSAWARINHSAGTPSLVDDYNVASLTDEGTGDTTVTFATAIASANYAGIATIGITATLFFATIIAQSTNAIRVKTWNTSNAAADSPFNVACMGS